MRYKVWMPAGARAPLKNLDVLRGCMATAVAVYHFAVWTRALHGAWSTLVTVLGLYSVQGFFILSGLCFFRAYGDVRFDWPVLWRFFVRRLLRIAPLFYVAIALSYLTGRPVDRYAGAALFMENLTLSCAVFHPNHAMVLGGWSIGIECLFYAVFPVLACVTRYRPALYILVPLTLAWAAPYSFGAVAAAAPDARFDAYVSVANHAFLFVLGGVVADVRSRVPWRLHALLMPLSCGLFCGLWWWTQPLVHDHLALVVGVTRVKYVLLCVLVVCAFALSRELPGRSAQLLGRLGQLSYSVYLMHPVAWFVVRRVLHADQAALWSVLLGLLVTLGLASWTQRYIEAPAMRWGRRLTC